jgi:hypothetical protein
VPRVLGLAPSRHTHSLLAGVQRKPQSGPLGAFIDLNVSRVQASKQLGPYLVLPRARARRVCAPFQPFRLTLALPESGLPSAGVLAN